MLYRLLSLEMMSDFIFAYVYMYSSSEPVREILCICIVDKAYLF